MSAEYSTGGLEVVSSFDRSDLIYPFSRIAWIGATFLTPQLDKPGNLLSRGKMLLDFVPVRAPQVQISLRIGDFDAVRLKAIPDTQQNFTV